MKSKTYKKKIRKKTYKRNNKRKKTYKKKNKKTYKRNKQSGGAVRRIRTSKGSSRYHPVYVSHSLDDTQEVPDDRIQPQLSVPISPSYHIKNEFLIGSDGLTVCYQMGNDLDINIIFIRWKLLKKVFKEFVDRNPSRFGRTNPRKHLKLSTKLKKIYPEQAGFKDEIVSRIRELNDKLRFINAKEEYKSDFDAVLNNNLGAPDIEDICSTPSLYNEITPSAPDLKNDDFQFDRNTRYCVCSMEVGYPVHSDYLDFHFFVAFEDNSTEGNGRIVTLGFNSTKSERVKRDNLGSYSKLFPNQLGPPGERSEANNDTGAYTCMDVYSSDYELNNMGLFGPFEGDGEYNKLAFTDVEHFEKMLFTDWESLRNGERVLAESLGLNKEYWNKKYYLKAEISRVSFDIEEGNLLTKDYESLSEPQKDAIRRLTRFNPHREGCVDIVRDKDTWEYKKLQLSHPYTNGCKIRKVVEWKRLSDIQIRFMDKIKMESNIHMEIGESDRDNSIYQMKYELFNQHGSASYPEYPWIISHKQLLDEKEEGNEEILTSLDLMKKSAEFKTSETFDGMSFDEAIGRVTVWDVKDFCKIQTSGYDFCCMEGSILFHNLDNLDNKEVIIEQLGEELIGSSDSGSDSGSDMDDDS